MFEYWLGRDTLSPLTWENGILKQTPASSELHPGLTVDCCYCFVVVRTERERTAGIELTDGRSQLKDTRRLSLYQIFTS